jgi:hypothetical protein
MIYIEQKPTGENDKQEASSHLWQLKFRSKEHKAYTRRKLE